MVIPTKAATAGILAYSIGFDETALRILVNEDRGCCCWMEELVRLAVPDPREESWDEAR